jgi:hypothetical protein
MEWPGGEEMGSAGGGDSLESLDEQLDDALGEFDESMGGGEQGAEEVDILDPMGGGGGNSSSDQPVFEDPNSGGEGEGGSGEDQGIAQRAASGASGSESGGQQGGASSGGESSSSGEQSGADSSGGGGGSAPPGEESATGNSGEDDQGSGDIIPIPDDVGDGRQDDIVLRQIREAAMNEKDPVLRERLWDEYRRIRDQR